VSLPSSVPSFAKEKIKASQGKGHYVVALPSIFCEGKNKSLLDLLKVPKRFAPNKRYEYPMRRKREKLRILLFSNLR